ncbi:hypothetical protein D9619_013062 [Psilocybe cf. subviscida]|uniref:GmrSD restriction endonucleases N-terminal domain-containing protein n=1 Tax=Psilocybe cf. subviscida TaxID=2480587 RepID=A0A8H5AZL3_9AGAR|nr:hypothetical protein D9619_013062 [Psilocybe cf. subviscida]
MDTSSELTDIESDYETTVKKKGKKASAKDHKGWRLRNVLKVPRATTYTAQALYDQILSCDINLEPEYQRDVVWTESKQIGIIDSVFRNFYIPPIIFAVNVDEDGAETKTCIDGKQRLTSIHKFMDGLIPHKDPFTGEKLWYKDINTGGRGPKKQLLPEKYRRLFANKQIVCVEYQGITDPDEREIFQRVQLGMALTPAEKLQIIKTDRADFVRQLQNEYMKENGYLGPQYLPWDVSRGSDYRGIAQAICCMDTFSNPKAPQPALPVLERWLSVEDPLPSATRKSMEDAFKKFVALVKDDKLNRVFSDPARISPLEFMGISLFIFVHKDKATLAQLSAGIHTMRLELRVQYLDIRQNNRVTKALTDFIRAWRPGGSTSTAKAQKEKKGTATGTKRKRTSKNKDDDDDDVDEEDMDVDGRSEESTSRAPAAKKANTTQKASSTARASMSASTAPAPAVKTEPRLEPVSVPATDRLASLRQAKEEVARKKAERDAQNPPNVPRAHIMTQQRNGTQPNPQKLPSPSQTYSTPGGIPHPEQTQGHAATQNLMDVMKARQEGGASSASQRLPGRERDRDYDRDHDRDRDRAKTHDRRDSGSFSQRGGR